MTDLIRRSTRRCLRAVSRPGYMLCGLYEAYVVATADPEQVTCPACTHASSRQANPRQEMS